MESGINLVCKIGSTALLNRDRTDIEEDIFGNICANLNSDDVLVTSGAVEIGKIAARQNNPDGYDESVFANADFASIGQGILIGKYQQHFDRLKRQMLVKQILIEHCHFNDDEKREHIKHRILSSRFQQALAVINYNDAVDSAEIRNYEIAKINEQKGMAFGGIDNDETATEVAKLVAAKRLLILTERSGIYENVLDESSLVREIKGAGIDNTVQKLKEAQRYCNGASRVGANGAGAKLEHVINAIKGGVKEIFIASSRCDIGDILRGRADSTYICCNS